MTYMRRPYRINARLSKQDYKTLQEFSDWLKMPMSEGLRQAIYTAKMYMQAEKAELAARQKGKQP